MSSADNLVEAESLIAAAIDAAEDIRDSLDGLVERTAVDPGAPFAPEALERLAALKQENFAGFEALRAQLKKAGCRVTVLDEAIAEENGEAGGRGPTQADILIELVQSAELFHTPDGTGFADLDINNHRETWPIRAKGFRRWLARRFFDATQGAPSSEALQSALNVIEAKAHFDAPERPVHIRVGELDGRLYLDLGDETWRAVEIDTTGWRVIDNPPVRFRLAAGMQPLPMPVPGGSVETLRSFLNVKSDADFVLVVAWALAVLRNRGPYPVIVLSGEQGSAKSTFSAILRALLDPNTAPLRALPREDRDLFIAASMPRWRASASPNPRPGPIALGRSRAGCAERRPSCARSASRSASNARAGRGHGSSTSPPPRRQKTPGRDRPHRPYLSCPRRNPVPPTASRLRPCGRSPMMRTVGRTVVTGAALRPSAPTR